MRILLAAAILSAAAPAFAATGQFSVAPQDAPRSVILIAGGESCAGDAASAHAALAAQAGRPVGVIAADAGCGAARALAPGADIALAQDAAALGADPNAFLSGARDTGIVVWDMAAWERLNLSGRRVLGLFEDAPAAAMIRAATAHLSRDGAGYFLLVQADALDGPALDALAAARAAGAEIMGAPMLRHADFSALD